MTRFPVITAVANVLAHAPGLVRYGSRPLRDIAAKPALVETITDHLRSYPDAVAYPPNQAYIGNLDPEALRSVPRPWWSALDARAPSTSVSEITIVRAAALPPQPSGGEVRKGGAAPLRGSSAEFGDLISEGELLGLLRLCDRARLLQLDEATLAAGCDGLMARGVVARSEVEALRPVPAAAFTPLIERGEAIPLWLGDRVVGAVSHGHEEDETLTANVLLENLAAKATGVVALRRLLRQTEGRVAPGDVDFVVSGSEEAVGDRYQRGGGNLAKAIAEDAGVTRATGFDVKAFCASTLYAIVNAAALIQAGLFSRVVVVAGGSLAKLGMKYRAHVAKQMPILEDVLAGVAILVEREGDGPVVRLDTLGLHGVATGTSQQAIVEALVMGPLAKAGCRLTDVDRYATEMHNPEVTEPAGSGDVPAGNYRLIAALGALRGEIPRTGIDDFITRHGLPGFAPTQGHIASAVCYVAHARRAMGNGAMKRALFMAKGSLFLGRMTQMADGVSFLLEA